jgi:hypothetical protein
MIFRGAVAPIYLCTRHTRHRHILFGEKQGLAVSGAADTCETHPVQAGEDGGSP